MSIVALLQAGCGGSPLPEASRDRSEAEAASADLTSDAPGSYRILPKPGAKIPLGSTHYFTYGFVNSPKIGTAVMKVKVYTREGKRAAPFTIIGDVDMPSMRGAHATGGKEFVVSAKGDYLLPVPLVMPGDWEFRFVFMDDGSTVLKGAYLFDL